jgi:cysteine desulfuration protein SufE
MESMTINQTIEEIISEFACFEDWMDKYNYLIEMGKSLPPLDERYKTESNLISGCQSRVWLHSELKGGIIYFYSDSDAVITKGIVCLLIRVFSDSWISSASRIIFLLPVPTDCFP